MGSWGTNPEIRPKEAAPHLLHGSGVVGDREGARGQARGQEGPHAAVPQTMNVLARELPRHLPNSDVFAACAAHRHLAEVEAKRPRTEGNSFVRAEQLG
jgi:hypothetical protein